MSRKSVFIGCFFTVVAVMGIASAAIANYDVEIAKNGTAHVTLLINGGGEFDISLPKDAKPKVKNCDYNVTQDGIHVRVNESAVVAYTSDFVTLEKGDMWLMQLELPDVEKSVVMASLPAGSVIDRAYPNARMIEKNGSVDVIWSVQEAKLVVVRYFSENLTGSVAASGQNGEMRPDNNSAAAGSRVQTDSGMPAQLIFGAAVLLAVFALAAALYLKRTGALGGKNLKSALILTEGKGNIIKTLTENEAKVVDSLMSHGGEAKRNKLSKLTGISKSSLAGALATLEAKRIVQVDKSRNIHYVSLTDWFRSL